MDLSTGIEIMQAESKSEVHVEDEAVNFGVILEDDRRDMLRMGKVQQLRVS